MLEQYFVLQSAYNLNTIRVVGNPSGSNAKTLYLYNRDITILYYSAKTQVEFIRDLKMNHQTFTKHLIAGTYYLNKYRFSRELSTDAELSLITVEELQNILINDRVHFNKTKTLSNLGNPIILTSNTEAHQFISLADTLRFLNSKGHSADRRTLVKRINTNTLYHGYKCEQ